MSTFKWFVAAFLMSLSHDVTVDKIGICIMGSILICTVGGRILDQILNPSKYHAPESTDYVSGV